MLTLFKLILNNFAELKNQFYICREQNGRKNEFIHPIHITEGRGKTFARL